MESFKKVIREYMEQRAQQDALFAATYSKPNKSIDGCCNYILKEARKKGNAVCMKDEEVYGLAVHYYDEDNINNIEPVEGATVTTTPNAAEPAKQPAPVVPIVRSKKAVDSRQMSLF